MINKICLNPITTSVFPLVAISMTFGVPNVAYCNIMLFIMYQLSSVVAVTIKCFIC